MRPYAKSKGPIAPPKSFDYHLQQCRIAAGLTKWPKNALRHSFGSYHFAAHSNGPLTAAELGHEGSTRTLFKHYRALAKPKDAAAFWMLVPTSDASAKVVSMRAA